MTKAANADAFVDSLVGELTRHPVNTNRFFRTFLSQRLTKSQLQEWLGQYHYFCKQFVKVLEGLLSRTPVDELEMRVQLVKTLHSELGSGRSEHAHIRLLERFAAAAGLNETDLQRISHLAAALARAERENKPLFIAAVTGRDVSSALTATAMRRTISYPASVPCIGSSLKPITWPPSEPNSLWKSPPQPSSAISIRGCSGMISFRPMIWSSSNCISRRRTIMAFGWLMPSERRLSPPQI